MWFFVYFIITGTLAYDFAQDFAKLSRYKCEAACWFNESEITTETIAKFPTCEYACAIIVLNQNTKVPVDKLQSTFSNLQVLKGGIRVENTTLTDLSFFSNLNDLRVDMIGITILNNPKLTDVGFLYNADYIQEPPFKIVNNLKLDVSTLCETPKYQKFMFMYVTNNLNDCGCRGENFGTSKFANCTSVFGAINIDSKTQNSKTLLSLANVKNITGNITVSNTALQNLSFFKSFEHFKIWSDDDFMNLDVHDNPNMTRLGLETLKESVLLNGDGAYLNVNLMNLHPDFCLTTNEIEFLNSANTHYKNLTASYCPVVPNPNGPKFCTFDKMSSLEEGCVKIMGRVLIAAGDEGYVDKLKDVTHIFGSLRVENTSLTNVDFLQELKQVVLLQDSTPVIQFVSNPKLQNLTLPNLKYPFNVGNKMFIVQDCPFALADMLSCLDLQMSVFILIVVDGGDCYTHDFSGAFLPGDVIDTETNSTGTGEQKDKSSQEFDFIIFLCWLSVFNWFCHK